MRGSERNRGGKTRVALTEKSTESSIDGEGKTTAMGDSMVDGGMSERSREI